MASLALTTLLDLRRSLLLYFLLLLPLLLLVRRRRMSGATMNQPYPPCPPRLPIVGNLHHLLCRSSLLHRSLHDMAARYGHIMLLQLGQVPVLIVSSADMARHVMKTQDQVFSSRPSLKVPNILLRQGRDVAFAPYGDYWRQAKKVSLLHLLSAKMVRNFRRVREESVAAMLDEVARSARRGHPIDMTRALNSLAKRVISRAVLGKSSAGEAWGDYVDEIMGEMSVAMGEFYVCDCFPALEPWLSRVTGLERRMKAIANRLDAILDEIIAARKAAGERSGITIGGGGGGGGAEYESTNLIDVLLCLQDDPEMQGFVTEETISSMVMDMYAAGMDSTHIAMDWVMAELIKNPRAMKKLQEEVSGIVGPKDEISEEDLVKMDYLKAVIKEALRLHPPGPLLVPREAMEETVIEGYKVPKGARTFVNVWAIGRDPKIWEQPERFYPERFLGSSIDFKGQHFELAPFGAGRRICPGIGFAVAVIELGLATLVHKFDWSLPDGDKVEDMDMSEVFGITMRRKAALQLVAATRSSTAPAYS